ncbi:MAG: GNAT family N-acetyltransferase [Rhizobiaceae bacterium]|nr:GNAT family N-acetyltransferase [Rhizobiaceae bacterium]MCV0408764.1 GNAT family N-acetyltransferase [Rhizobiaceae bacterium]
MTPMRTERLILRNWEERDRALFHRINSDELVMEFFPFRRTRAESDAFMDRLAGRIAEVGYGFAAAEIVETGETIGFIGVLDNTPVPGAAKADLEIGWRLAPEYWGMGYVTEVAGKWLEFAFNDLDRSHVWSFAVAVNRRSTAVMDRLGMERVPERDFDHPKVPDTHPHLQHHVVYRLMRENWRGPNASKSRT